MFGEAEDSPNFLIDGFFADERTGLTLEQTATSLLTTGYYGDYETLFGPWNTQQDVAEGLFWDFDDNPDTDNLLMAWEISEDQWELRRTVGETCDPNNPANCTPGETLDTYQIGSLAEIIATLTDDQDPWFDLFNTDDIEDLANLNLNYALDVGDMTGQDSFTIRTTAIPVAPVPLPATAPLIAAGLGVLALFRRRRSKPVL